jgi:aryl-alcohol dehydrogenase-like predicted oxidoreductase
MNVNGRWYEPFTAADLRKLARQYTLLRRLVDALRRRNDEYEALLNTALHELALEHGEDPPQFTLRWLREHRKPDREGIP